MNIHKVKLTEINPHLICALCNGYLINATTAVECLHTFCKSCIYNYLQDVSLATSSDKKMCCPICETLMNRSKPSLSLQPDPTLQNIVYSLVPNLYSTERIRKLVFYQSEKRRRTLLKSPNPDLNSLFKAETPIKTCNHSVLEVTVEYLVSPGKISSREIPKCVFRIPTGVTLADLEQVMRAKFNLHQSNFLDFYYTQTSECIKKYYNMEEIFLIIQQSLEQMVGSLSGGEDSLEDDNQSAISSADHVTSLSKRMEKAGFEPCQGKMKILYRIYAVKNKNKKATKAAEDKINKGGVTKGSTEKRKSSSKDDHRGGWAQNKSEGTRFRFDNLDMISKNLSADKDQDEEDEDVDIHDVLQRKPVATNFSINSLLK